MSIGAKTYSVRFLAAGGSSVGVIWTCPAGKRAVVQTVTLANNGSVAGSVEVSIDAYLVQLLQAPAKNSTSLVNQRWVLYAGEGLKFFSAAANLYVTAHGYLFDDVAGAADDGQVAALEPAASSFPEVL